MADLYFEADITRAISAAKTAGEYAVKGQLTDIHCVDAALEAAGQIHALTREHIHPVGTTDCPDDPCLVGERILALCDEYDAQPVQSTEAGLNPNQIALLVQIAVMVGELLKDWWKS